MMLRQVEIRPLRVIVIALFCAFEFSACGGSYEDTIAGIALPVPKSMTKSSEAPVEMKFFGFGAGQASYHGKMESDKIVEFYNRELPARGWQPGASMRAGGAMLAYSKEAKTLMVAIGKQNDETSLTLTIGGTDR
ncbi:MAG TPA: hypothetical protein VGH22_07910 [Candidatus Binatia bacterium]|jgi:hypothetical protein